jgi:hypothetical protein
MAHNRNRTGAIQNFKRSPEILMHILPESSIMQESDSDLFLTEHPYPGDYPHAALIYTAADSSAKQFKWVDSTLRGTLRFYRIDYKDVRDFIVKIPPVVIIRLISLNDEILFEAELPLNLEVV